MKKKKILTFSTINRGEIRYDLNHKHFSFKHLDFIRDTAYFPFSIQHVYQFDSKDYGYGKGFRLNLEQTLSKVEGTSTYKLFLADGSEELFQELYYYKDQEGNRVYETPDGKAFTREDITVEEDGNLKYGNKTIYVDLKTETGLALKSDYKDFNNSQTIDFRNEELISLEQEITQIKQTIEDLDYQYQEYDKYESQNYMTLDTLKKAYQKASQEYSKCQLNGFNLTDKEDLLNSKKEYYNKTKRAKRILGGLVSSNPNEYRQENITFKDDLQRYAYEDYNGYSAERYAALDKGINYVDTMTVCAKISEYYTQEFTDELNVLNQNLQKLSIDIETKELAYQKNLYGKQQEVSNKEQAFLDAQEAYDIEQIEKIKKYYSLLRKRVCLQKNQYEIILKQKEYQKEELLKQMPELFLFDDKKMGYGFNKYGKLSLLFDSYGHQAVIHYNSSNQIKSIIDTDDHIIEFIYNEKNQLNRIVDDDNNYIDFSYEYGKLKQFIYPDGKVFSLNYNGDFLTEVLDTDDIGYRFSNINQQITGITTIALDEAHKQLEDKELRFSYLDNQIIIRDSFTNFSIHYLFDTKDDLVTEYSEINEDLKEITCYEYGQQHCSIVIHSNKNDSKLLNVSPGSITGKRSYTVLPPNHYTSDCILYASVKADSFEIGEKRVNAYCNHTYGDYSESKFALKCSLVYDKYQRSFITTFNPKIKGKQFAAVPITLDEDSFGNICIPNEIIVEIDYSNNNGECEVYNITMAQGEFNYCEYDKAHHKIFESFSETCTPKVADFAKKGQYVQKKEIRYIYNSKELLEKQMIQITYEEYDSSENLVQRHFKEFSTQYLYNQYNQVVKEQDNLGNIVEYMYTKQGDCIQRKCYCISMPNLTYLDEKEVDKNGRILTETNPLGYKNLYQYSNRILNSISTPNGNLLNIHTSSIAESISTETNGIESYSSIIYNSNGNMEYRTEGMSYKYTYDEFGREKELYINDRLYCRFEIIKSQTKMKYRTIFTNNTGYEKVTDIYDKLLEVNLIISKDKISPFLQYSYDEKDNLIKQSRWNNDQEIYTEYIYIEGELAGIKTNQLTKSLQYNAYGNLENHTYHIDEDIYKGDFQYDSLNRIISSSYTKNSEDSFNEKYQYDSLNRITNIKHPLIESKYSYLSKNGRTTNLVSVQQKRIKDRYQRNTYQYDKEGNLVNKTENYHSTRYAYDSMNQLIREDNEELNQTIFYQYDSNGNIQLKEIYEYSLSNNLENKRIKEYNYNDFNDYLTGYSDKEIRIDELGRTCMYDKTILHWNQSELKQYGEVEFCYNENHIRTKKSKNGKTIEYIVDGSRILKEKRKEYSTHLENRIDEFSTIDISEEELEYIYTPVGIIGFDYIKENIKRRYYYNKNILGDILEIYDEEGQLVGKYIYDAYGNHQVINYTQDNIGDINPFRYRGYYYDTETGLYLVTTRYYNPEWCRFISHDSIEYLDPSSINGLNLYAYCGNDPVNRFDPSGHAWEWSSFWQGVGYLATGIGAIVAGALVIASGVATWPMLLVAGITIGAGALTSINGASEVVEAGTGYNFVEDTVFGGNSSAYNTYATITGSVATVGSLVCGGWYKYNTPRIQAYKNVGNYSFSGTLSDSKHLARPYQHSTLLQRNIIKYGKMVKESSGIYNFTIGGAYKIGWVSYGVGNVGSHPVTWKLVLDIGKQIISHAGF